MSFLPFAKQLKPLSANGHSELLYSGYELSGTQRPSKISQTSASPVNPATKLPLPRYPLTLTYMRHPTTSTREARQKAAARSPKEGGLGATHNFRRAETLGLLTILGVNRAGSLLLNLPLTIYCTRESIKEPSRPSAADQDEAPEPRHLTFQSNIGKTATKPQVLGLRPTPRIKNKKKGRKGTIISRIEQLRTRSWSNQGTNLDQETRSPQNRKSHRRETGLKPEIDRVFLAVCRLVLSELTPPIQETPIPTRDLSLSASFARWSTELVRLAGSRRRWLEAGES